MSRSLLTDHRLWSVFVPSIGIFVKPGTPEARSIEIERNGAMRCPGCNKFASLEMQDPEIENVDIDADELDKENNLPVTVSANIRIVRISACCSEEMKEANLEINETVTIDVEDEHATKGKWKKGHGVADEHDYDDPPNQIEQGGSRYAKSFYGAELTVRIKCTCGGELGDFTVSDQIAASTMNEMC